MRSLLLPILFLAAVAPLSHADTFEFTFNGTYTPLPEPPDNGPIGSGTNLSFSYQLAAPPTLFDPGDGETPYFRYNNVSVTGHNFGGIFNLYQFSYATQDPTNSTEDATFLTNNGSIYDSYGIAGFTVPQGFYTGPDSSPSYIPGTYSASFDYRDYSNYDGTFTVTDLSTGTTATPEPSTLLLLGTGLATVAGLRRRRPRHLDPQL